MPHDAGYRKWKWIHGANMRFYCGVRWWYKSSSSAKYSLLNWRKVMEQIHTYEILSTSGQRCDQKALITQCQYPITIKGPAFKIILITTSKIVPKYPKYSKWRKLKLLMDYCLLSNIHTFCQSKTRLRCKTFIIFCKFKVVICNLKWKLLWEVQELSTNTVLQ